MKSHGWWMILCCLLPLLGIFLLPFFGLARNDLSVLLVVVMMFICHFVMMGGHHKNKGDSDEGPEEKKGGPHGCH